ncbi:glycoside hydrolase family 65 protein [Streptantibioticus silvisoli]|uniref:Glycosyl hydrolase family 65 protein n=1 Tax=Streptantibioticus silvisoli TaxID=2705255 RepID=A0ABT6W6U6_9ACTN|nr:glycosyl hydrolase family 65 protein [Streptantibioticus silvisoli]MDI5966476.1 glycosyl hydrolase family 65 protein [Streptantibioticus silvisoli]
MITHPAFSCAPWNLTETELNLDVLPQSESVFALSNGHVGWRGNLDEGEPHGLPGTYLNGLHELRRLPYAEAGYGYPESGQSVINVTNGKVLRLLVDDEPFDLRYGQLHHHERVLDFRTGLLHRTAEWTSPAGRRVRLRSTRLVSLTQRAIAALRWEIEPVDEPVQVVVQSELIANEQMPGGEGDPRAASSVDDPLESQEHHADGTSLRLIHRTRHSGLLVAAAAGHRVQGPTGTQTHADSSADLARFTVVGRLEPGQRLCVDKTVAYGWSGARSRPAVRDQVDAALAAGERTGWQGLVDEQRAYLDDFWDRSDVEVEGDPEVQQAVRFALFHVLQAGARAEERAIAAKGLTGSGYDGHSFWDTEGFVLPMLTYTAPLTVAHALRWRHSTLPAARDRARQLGLRGATFPWRTIAGEECSAYWPAGTAAFHINAAVADAVIRYTHATGDTAFERDIGLELLVETARMWASLGHHDHDGVFHIDGVTGPDEYSAVCDDNTYTNLMAQANLRAAADCAEHHQEIARGLGVDHDETEQWRAAADGMAVPYDKRLEVHEQAVGYTGHAEWDFDNTGPDDYPLMLHYPYFDLYRKQVIKQADLVLAMFVRGEAFTAEQKARNFEYYERITVRDSSLSACCQAVLAAETGHLGLAYDYLGEAATMDLLDLEHNTRDGLHIASLAGTWIALVSGFGGMRSDGGELRFAPRLPPEITRLAFRVTVLGSRLHVEVTRNEARYSLDDGDDSLTVRHFGRRLTVAPGRPAVRTLPDLPLRPAPQQPPGRAPHHRTPAVKDD